MQRCSCNMPTSLGEYHYCYYYYYYYYYYHYKYYYFCVLFPLITSVACSSTTGAVLFFFNYPFLFVK